MSAGVLLWVNCGPKENSKSLVDLTSRSSIGRRTQRRLKVYSRISFGTGDSAASGAVVADPSRSSEERVYEVVLKQAALIREQRRGTTKIALDLDKTIEADFANGGLLNEAYDRCGEVCAEYAKTFYLGTQLMTQERRKAIWAIYVWCRRFDELVDGPNSSRITSTALDRWEQRLTDVLKVAPMICLMLLSHTESQNTS